MLGSKTSLFNFLIVIAQCSSKKTKVSDALLSDIASRLAGKQKSTREFASLSLQLYAKFQPRIPMS
jgi:hypothetical protein